MICILRGMPGSGKSTWAKNIQKSVVCSADDYHTIDEVYKFDPTNAKKAHDACFKKFINFVTDQIFFETVIVVDNTNTTLVELAPYVRLCEVFEHEYKIFYFQCSLEESIKRNIHGVPFNTLLTMQKNLLTEIVPPWWKQELAEIDLW